MTIGRRRFLRDLAAVREATGAELVSPGEPEAEDLRTAHLVAEVVRTGWVTERVESLKLTPTPEGARNIPLQGGDDPVTISAGSTHASVRLLGREISLGPSTHWIERARMVTPPERVRGWLDSEPAPEDLLELLFVPIEGSLLHTFFPECPKPSRERVRRQLRAFEGKHGMKSEEFAVAWRKGKQSVRRVESGKI